MLGFGVNRLACGKRVPTNNSFKSFNSKPFKTFSQTSFNAPVARGFSSNNIDFSFFDNLKEPQNESTKINKSVHFSDCSMKRAAEKKQPSEEFSSLFSALDEIEKEAKPEESAPKPKNNKIYIPYKKKSIWGHSQEKGDDFLSKKEALDDLILSFDLNPRIESGGLLFKAILNFVERGKFQNLPPPEQIRHLFHVLDYFDDSQHMILLLNFLAENNFKGDLSVYSDILKSLRDLYISFTEKSQPAKEQPKSWKFQVQNKEKNDYFSWHNDMGLLFKGIGSAISKGYLKDISVISFFIGKTIDNLEISASDVAIMLKSFSKLYEENDNFTPNHFNTWFRLVALDIIHKYTRKKLSPPYLKKSELRNILKAMRRKGDELSVNNLRAMLRVFEEYSIPRLTLETLDLLAERFEYTPDTFVVFNILNVVAKSESSSTFDKYYLSLKDRIELSDKTYINLLHSLLDNNNVNSTMILFKDSLQKGINYNFHLQVISKIFRLLCETARYEEAVLLLQDLPKIGINLDNGIVTLVLNFLIQAQQEDEVEKVLSFLTSSQVTPDVHLSNTLARYYIRNGQREKLHSLFDYMLAHNFYLNDRNLRDTEAKGFLTSAYFRLQNPKR